jgi:hypothetical protein
MKKTPMEKAVDAIHLEIGWEMEEDDLADLLDLHKRRSTAAIEKERDRLTKGEWGGESTEVQAKIGDLSILLVARRVLERVK